MPDLGDPPPDVVLKLRVACSDLPEAYEEPAWVGTRWRIRKHTMAHLFTADSERGSAVVLEFRSAGPEREVLESQGHPFFAGWGPGIVGMIIDDDTDWTEVAELMTERATASSPRRSSSPSSIARRRTSSRRPGSAVAETR